MRVLFSYLFLKVFYVFIFRDRGREGEREEEKHQCVVASHTLPTGDLAHNPGMCPDWESKLQPFGPQASTQSTKPHQPGPLSFDIIRFLKFWEVKSYLTFLWELLNLITLFCSPFLPLYWFQKTFSSNCSSQLIINLHEKNFSPITRTFSKHNKSSLCTARKSKTCYPLNISL